MMRRCPVYSFWISPSRNRITILRSDPVLTESRPVRSSPASRRCCSWKNRAWRSYSATRTQPLQALAAVKVHIPVAHVEAGLRSFDRTMPEEINRVVTDHISDLLFCPTETAVRNLSAEGITKGVHLVGDVMVDALEYNRGIAEKRSKVLEQFGLNQKGYLVVTVHRPANTDNRENMECILSALGDSGLPVLFPVHPRTKRC